jgi:hypothetical protein
MPQKLCNMEQLDKSIQITNIVRQLVVTNVHQRTTGSGLDVRTEIGQARLYESKGYSERTSSTLR